MKSFAFAIPGDLALPTGGYAYDRRIIRECRQASWRIDHLPLPGDFPDPSPESLTLTEAAFMALPEDQPILVDGLAFGALPAELIRRCGRRFLALVHHPLALETGLQMDEQARLYKLERAALDQAMGVIVTSAFTGKALIQDYGVPNERLTVALPGTDPAARAIGSGDVPAILAVGAVVPRKGYIVLVESLSRLRQRSWTCRIVGALDRAPAETARVMEAIDRLDLGDRILLAGQISDDTLEAAFSTADLFALPSFHEGYGMVLAEALAHGLPIAATTGGAIPDTAPADAALLTTPGDIDAFALALERLLTDRTLRQSLSDAAWRAGQALPRWPETARTIMGAIERAGPHPSLRSQS